MLFLLAAALSSAGSPLPIPPAAQIRIIRAAGAAPRFVRLRSTITGGGMHGTAVSVVDLTEGRYVERVAAGPLSWSDGFDGRRNWSADATQMAIVEGNADSVRDQLAWAHFYGRTGPETPIVQVLARHAGALVLRLTYPRLTGPIDVTLNSANGTVRSIVDRSGAEVTRARFADYRHVGALLVPFTSDDSNRYGVWRDRVRSVDFPRALPDDTFAPPPPPHDTALDGVTTVSMEPVSGSLPVVTVDIGGKRVRMLFDSGGSNSLTSAAARRLGLRILGEDTAGGVGEGLVRQRYATVTRMRIGGAELRTQPFSIIDDASMPAIDGSIGCEVLQRFAVRFDFRARQIDLARDARAFALPPSAIPIRFSGCQPEADGDLDGIRGPIAIDTGSAFGVDVMSPATRAYRLIAHYRATETIAGIGLGGESVGYGARARTLRIGSLVAHDIPLKLNLSRKGAFSDPTVLGNVGTAVLGRYVITFDYRTNRMWLVPPQR